MTNVEMFNTNFVRVLDDCYICVGYVGYINVSFKDMDWKNILVHNNGAYILKHGAYIDRDSTGL